MNCEIQISNVAVCKDELNTPQCEYSNGQCCGDVRLHFCSECHCKDPRNKEKRGNKTLQMKSFYSATFLNPIFNQRSNFIFIHEFS